MTVTVQRHVTGEHDAAQALRDRAHRPTAPAQAHGSDRAPRLQFVAARSARLGVNHLDTTIPIEAEVCTPDLFSTVVIHRGSVQSGDGRSSTRLGAGTAVAMPRFGSHTSTADATVQVCYFPVEVLHRVAWEHFDLEPGVLRLETAIPLSGAPAARWGRLVTHLQTELTRPVSLLEHTFIETDYLEDAAFLALNLFANNAANADHRREASWSAPSVARRGAAYIDENAHRDITLSGIARAAGTSPAELTRAFLDHFGVPPMPYLQRVRLHLVHGLLLTSDPSDGTTVEAVARRFGFRDHESFVALYVLTFGRGPDDTLRS